MAPFFHQSFGTLILVTAQVDPDPGMVNSMDILQIVLILMLIVVLVVFGFTVRRIRAQEADLKQMVEERTRDLQRQTIIAQEANEIKSHLLSLAAHDLKSPLISIRGFVQLLLDDLRDRSEAQQKAETIQRLSQSMLDLINELLDSVAIESGEVDISRRPVDLGLLAVTVVEMHRVQAERKGQTIQSTADATGTCMVLGDPSRLQGVLANLLTNAIKYSPRDRSIWVEVSRSGNDVVYRVRDEGPGLTDDDKARLFSRFNRLSARPTDGEPSSGLGLWIVKHLVELHGGTVSGEGSPAGGATFTVVLPQYQPEADHAG